jgi:phage gpG-like protein
MGIFNTIKKNILRDIKVELTEEFDRNFERKGFFTNRWSERKRQNVGTLLQATGTLRKSIRSKVENDSVVFNSSVPYALAHNTGYDIIQNIRPHTRQRKKDKKKYLVRAHTRKINMPQRQFIGNSHQVQSIVKNIVNENLQQIGTYITKKYK